MNMNKPQIKTITPEIAREMLKCNTRNLPVRQTHVDYLASEMSAGRWQLTHQGIAFDGDVLVDGQHRLLAVVQSGATVEMWVFGDVPLEVQAMVDKGRIRSVADELSHFDGVEHAKAKAAACRAVLSICCYFQSIKMSSGSCKKILSELERDLDFVIEATKPFKPAQRNWIQGALAIAVSGDRNVVPFIEAFGSGENLKAGDPAKAVRDWLTNGGRNIRSSYKRAAVEGIFNAAYNATTGDKITTIKRGVQGMNYFLNKKRKFVSSVRDDSKQQMEILPAA